MSIASEVSEIELPPRYQLQAILKENPSTCVYRVFDAADRRDEAIKILRQEFTEAQDFLQFRSEFSTLAALDHPTIIKVYDFGLLSDRFPYFTMEYFPGRKITEFFNGQNWEVLYDLIFQLGSGLHHIHHFGIVHLDVKPSNILVNDEGKVKLMDFGVSAGSHELFDRRIRGTLHYMAPEVLRQQKIDSRADLYGLGMTLYETVTGALPTWGRAPIDIIRFHLDEEIRRPSAINPNIPERLEKIILKLLEKDPRHRYPSAAALLREVADAAGVKVPAGGLLVGSGELLASPLIGRSHEVDELMAVITRARDGNGGGIIIAGPEGQGKSRVVREATLRGQLEGARVFAGSCPLNRKSIYAPFFEIFQQMVKAVNPTADPNVELRRILRPVLGGAGNEGKPSRGQKYRMFNRIVQSIQDIHGFLNVVGTGSSPLVLVVEDLQWADPSTAELFFFLINESKRSNLIVIGTLTTDREQDALEEGLGRAAFWEQRARESSVPLIRLEPMNEGQIREFVESVLGEESLSHDFIRWMLWESGGSPMQVRRIVDYLIGHEYLRFTAHGWVPDMERIQALRLPGGAGAIWTDKLESLENHQRQMLRSAAVLGDKFDLQTLNAVVEGQEEETYRFVKEFANQGLLEESNDGRMFAFPQMSLREAIYLSIPERDRADLHRRAATTLEVLLDDGAAELIGQVAYHFARGNEHEKGIDFSIRAGIQASTILAHEQASEFYRIALELMDLSGEEERKPEVREKLGDAYYRSNNLRGAMQVYQFLLKSIQARSGDESLSGSAEIMKKIGKVLAKRGEYEAALSYFQNAMQAYQRLGSKPDMAETLNRIAWMHKENGQLSEAERSALEAARLLEATALSPVHGYLRSTLGVIELARGNWQNAATLFEEALAIGEQLGSEPLKCVTRSQLGNVMWKLGDWDRALEYFRRNLEQSENDGDLWDLVTSYNNVAMIEFSRGDFHAAAELFLKSLRIDERLGAPEHEAVAQENLGKALEMIGRWGEARDRYNRCLTLEGFDEARTSRISVYVPLARLICKTGDIVKGLELAHKAYEAASRARDEPLLAEAAFVLAQIEQERENFPPATRFLAEATALFEAHANRHGMLLARNLAADLAFRQQSLDEAAAHAEVARTMAEQLRDRFSIGQNDAILGKIFYVNGERELAEAKFESAQAIFDELDTPYDMGRLFFEFGLLKEEVEEASVMIRRAVKIFERLEATHDLERARGALFRVRPTGKASSPNVVGLYEIVKIVNSTLNLQEVLNRVLDIALRRLRGERGMLILVDPITSALKTRVVRNINETEGEAKTNRSPQRIIKEVIQSGQSVISADARADERFANSESVIAENIVSTLCVPVVIRERIAGAIYVDHRQTRHLFSQRDLNFLEAFADQAAIAIENARLYEELEEAKARLSLENETLRKEVLVEKHLDSVVGHSQAVLKIQFTIKKAASAHSTVLLRGESGTGKGLVARIIHNVGPRRNGPFIKFNCAALPETLAESELFGHEKGAFTGADRRKLGRFELASGGTIFLDEIGKVSLAVQAKLLRVVEDKEFERVGGTQTIKVDVKIIAATNLEIEKAIEDGSFREDLFYRLNIVPLVLPPLRERKEDIPTLSEYFIKKICKDLGVEPKRLEPGILDLFDHYNWPGNVRELEATLHRAIVMSNDDNLTRTEFFQLLSDPNQVIPKANVSEVPHDLLSPLVKRMQITDTIYDDILSRVDRQLIQQALEEAGGKIRETARRLGLARNTLKAKLLKYGIHVGGD